MTTLTFNYISSKTKQNPIVQIFFNYWRLGKLSNTS